MVRSLQDVGYSAELVGGSVRDLLLGFQPKDFDVVTSAEPGQIRRIFRRSRILGRRFQLVHVRVGREPVEVSTYRTLPQANDTGCNVVANTGQIVTDNAFGNRDDDAQRRDFSVNALYYDPICNILLDYDYGFYDLKKRVLRAIGDPRKRFQEDPARMLRAIRFSVRLCLRMDENMQSALYSSADFLPLVAPARLFDEVVKVFHCGMGCAAFKLLNEYGLWSHLFPGISELEREPCRNDESSLILIALRNTDRRVADGKPVTPAFLFAVFLWHLVCTERKLGKRRGMTAAQSMHWATTRVVNGQQYIAISRRVAGMMSDIWSLQRWLEARRPHLIPRILIHKRFRAAYDFLLLRIAAGEVHVDVGNWWTDIQEVSNSAQREMISQLVHKRKRRRH